MKLYLCGNKIIDGWIIEKQVCHILGLTVDDLIKAGILQEAAPTVEDCVRLGNTAIACVLYEEEHNCGINEAFEAVQKIKKQLKETN